MNQSHAQRFLHIFRNIQAAENFGMAVTKMAADTPNWTIRSSCALPVKLDLYYANPLQLPR